MGSTNSTFSGLPVPDENATNDTPYWLSQLIASLDTKTVLTAVSTSDRDSKFFNAPAGVVCVVKSVSNVVSGVYVKTSDVGTAVWSAIWTAPGPLKQVPIPLADGFQTANGKSPIAVFNPVPNTWTLYGNISAVNSTNISSATTLGTIPPAVSLSTVQPYYEGAGVCSVGGTGSVPGVCKISVTASGSIIVYLASGVATPWVSLDLITLPGA